MLFSEKKPASPDISEAPTNTLESQSDAGRSRNGTIRNSPMATQSTTPPNTTTDIVGDSIETTVKPEAQPVVLEKDEATAKAVEEHYNQTNSTLAELNATRRRRMERDRR